jgi:hypothetical protein
MSDIIQRLFPPAPEPPAAGPGGGPAAVELRPVLSRRTGPSFPTFIEADPHGDEPAEGDRTGEETTAGGSPSLPPPNSEAGREYTGNRTAPATLPPDWTSRTSDRIEAPARRSQAMPPGEQSTARTHQIEAAPHAGEEKRDRASPAPPLPPAGETPPPAPGVQAAAPPRADRPPQSGSTPVSAPSEEPRPRRQAAGGGPESIEGAQTVPPVVPGPPSGLPDTSPAPVPVAPDQSRPLGASPARAPAPESPPAAPPIEASQVARTMVGGSSGPDPLLRPGQRVEEPPSTSTTRQEAWVAPAAHPSAPVPEVEDEASRPGPRPVRVEQQPAAPPPARDICIRIGRVEIVSRPAPAPRPKPPPRRARPHQIDPAIRRW